MKRRLVLAALTLLTPFWGEARAVTLDEIAAVAAKTPSFAADFKMVKKTPCKFTCKDVFFCYFIGRQPYSEGILSRAVHGVTFSFALDFLGLTTFLRQILGKIYLSDFLTTPHLFYY